MGHTEKHNISIKALQYAAAQICRHFEMLNQRDYENARFKEFIGWYKPITEKIASGETPSEPEDISYSYDSPVPALKVSETLPNGFRFDFHQVWRRKDPANAEYSVTVEELVRKAETPNSRHLNITIKTASLGSIWHIPKKKYARKKKIASSISDPFEKWLTETMSKEFDYPFYYNFMIISSPTKYADILMHLLIIALRDKFIDYDEEVLRIFKSYVTNKKNFNISRYKQEIDRNSSLFNETLLHIVNNFSMPKNKHSFKFYLYRTFHGKAKDQKRKDAIVIPQDCRVAQLATKSHISDNLTENMNAFQIFRDVNEHMIGSGVDRFSMETGISRYKIYRLIREGRLKPPRLRGTYYLNEKTIKALGDILRSKRDRKNHLITLSAERNITIDSARKKLYRSRKKNLTKSRDS